ncbi:unnamed protein product [Trichobilharzia regenti]|nr:unnamed protein product [Trichobilharzia regenti]
MFRSYGVASALVLLAFLVLNYFMPIPAVSEEPTEEDKMYSDIASSKTNVNQTPFGKLFFFLWYVLLLEQRINLCFCYDSD